MATKYEFVQYSPSVEKNIFVPLEPQWHEQEGNCVTNEGNCVTNEGNCVTIDQML